MEHRWVQRYKPSMEFYGNLATIDILGIFNRLFNLERKRKHDLDNMELIDSVSNFKIVPPRRSEKKKEGNTTYRAFLR